MWLIGVNMLISACQNVINRGQRNMNLSALWHVLLNTVTWICHHCDMNLSTFWHALISMLSPINHILTCTYHSCYSLDKLMSQCWHVHVTVLTCSCQCWQVHVIVLTSSCQCCQHFDTKMSTLWHELVNPIKWTCQQCDTNLSTFWHACW
jgi:hypothetical protein